jgi:hypothetical protein
MEQIKGPQFFLEESKGPQSFDTLVLRQDGSSDLRQLAKFDRGRALPFLRRLANCTDLSDEGRQSSTQTGGSLVRVLPTYRTNALDGVLAIIPRDFPDFTVLDGPRIVEAMKRSYTSVGRFSPGSDELHFWGSNPLGIGFGFSSAEHMGVPKSLTSTAVTLYRGQDTAQMEARCRNPAPTVVMPLIVGLAALNTQIIELRKDE